jgi:hypothetical protein
MIQLSDFIIKKNIDIDCGKKIIVEANNNNVMT